MFANIQLKKFPEIANEKVFFFLANFFSILPK